MVFGHYFYEMLYVFLIIMGVWERAEKIRMTGRRIVLGEGLFHSSIGVGFLGR